MKPGRELDALVAEKVMGWTQNIYGRWVSPEGGNPKTISTDPPRFSEDIAAVWEVVERLNSFGFLLERFGYRWRCDLSSVRASNSTEEGYSVGRAETAPHAICLAALKAFGVTDKP